MNTRNRRWVISIAVIVCILGMQGDAFAQRKQFGQLFGRHAPWLLEQAQGLRFWSRKPKSLLEPTPFSEPKRSSDLRSSQDFQYSPKIAPLVDERYVEAPLKSHEAGPSDRTRESWRQCTASPIPCNGICRIPWCSCVRGYCAP